MIANHVGIYSKDCFYYLMPAFDNKKWSIFSPGSINLIELIKWSINNRINYFDFTTGDEKYKTHWFDKEIEIRDNIQIFSFKGSLFSNYIMLKMKLKKNTFFKNLKKDFNYIINY